MSGKLMNYRNFLRPQQVSCLQKTNGSCARQHVGRRPVLAAGCGEVHLIGTQGSKHSIVAGKDFRISTDSSADLHISDASVPFPREVVMRHEWSLIRGANLPTANMSVRSGRAFLKVLAPENEDDTQLSSGYFVDSNELRPGVAYMLTPGAILSFGSPGEQSFRVDFEEPGTSLNPLFDILMKGMAQSDEVRKQLDL